MNRTLVLLSVMLFLAVSCGVNDTKEEAEILQYKDQPLQRDGDRLNPRRD